MTDKVNPSQFRPAEAFKTAGAIALGGGQADGYITSGSNPSQLSVQDSGIDETQFDAFSATTSTTSFDVTISAGEAFVYGAWSAIDTSTTVTLASSTADQTVYVGWNKDGTNDVIVGLQAAFDNATGNTDQKIPLFDFTTDGSGVTSSTDRRLIGDSITVDEDGNVAFSNGDLESGDGEGAIEIDSTGSLADTGKAQLSRDAEALGYVMIQDVTNGTSAMFFLGGVGQTVEKIHDTGTNTNYTTIEDNDGTTNVYYDGTNSRYEINNETGGSATYSVEVLKG